MDREGDPRSEAQQQWRGEKVKHTNEPQSLRVTPLRRRGCLYSATKIPTVAQSTRPELPPLVPRKIFRVAESPPLGPESPPWACGTKVPPRTSDSVPFDTCGLASWLICGRTGDSALGKAGVSAPQEQSSIPQVSVVFRLTSGITQVSGHFGGGGVSAWNHPGGRSLRHARNTSVPPKISGEHPPHACVLTHTESGKSIGVSALVSPRWPETPPQTGR